MKKIFIISLLILFSYVGTQAQNTKLAYLNADRVLADMPEIADADAQLQKTNKEYSNYVSQLKEDYTQKLSYLQQNKDSLSAFIIEQKAKEINSIDQQITEFQQKAQQDLIKKRNELYDPIKKKLFDAIEQVRKEKGYTDVLNTSTGLLLASDGKNNIEKDVRKKLGLN